ncbi:uncharacterized protein PgNI_09073 [Pyricularia grisea]|uniref:FAD-binding PCMH-type domain-containing protein n=1 Tax=Pyricularia grisea TaxID=148305 RepID=A0A6P8ARQ1_PYRGI|nr:uncharacterized protein PgNI_09073 [Pyricularia grisea]TLD04772.1 hypothetical protein PgNI_09073 [Pyricularia grisea]
MPTVYELLSPQSSNRVGLVGVASFGNVSDTTKFGYLLLPPSSYETPKDDCWPSAAAWSDFNKTVGGKLIKNTPVALPCYYGITQDDNSCQAVQKGWTSPNFQADAPVGYDYPVNLTCPLISLGAAAADGNCSLGNAPVFAVNVTAVEDISQALSFARERNLRVVVKSTGHDFMQRQGCVSQNLTLSIVCNSNPVFRSTGYASLSIWLRHLRNGIAFHDANPELEVCPESGWNGSSLTISGSYSWDDIYPIARNKGVLIVGGDNADLFFAIRGGGPGTYGVVTELSVRTYKDDRTASVATVNVDSPADDAATSRFLDAVTTMYEAMPDLSRKGFSGYGLWSAPQSFLFLGDGDAARRLFRPFEEKMTAFASSQHRLDVKVDWATHSNYGSYYASKTDTNASVGSFSAMSSRLLGSEALANRTRLRAMAAMSAAATGSAVQSGWYRSIVLDIFETQVNDFSVAENKESFAYLRGVLAPAMADLSPGTGTYMNEADWGSVHWREDFYGEHWERLSAVKQR